MYNKKENKLYAEKHEAMINKLFQTQNKHTKTELVNDLRNRALVIN